MKRAVDLSSTLKHEQIHPAASTWDPRGGTRPAYRRLGTGRTPAAAAPRARPKAPFPRSHPARAPNGGRRFLESWRARAAAPQAGTHATVVWARKMVATSSKKWAQTWGWDAEPVAHTPWRARGRIGMETYDRCSKFHARKTTTLDRRPYIDVNGLSRWETRAGSKNRLGAKRYSRTVGAAFEGALLRATARISSNPNASSRGRSSSVKSLASRISSGFFGGFAGGSTLHSTPIVTA